eukprot:Polyplicarium_translucidae@DN1433_c0_g1_i1.p1
MRIVKLHFNELPSTQVYVHQRAAQLCQSHELDARKWLRVSADSQTAGIGTFSNSEGQHKSWQSGRGNVHVSFLIPLSRSRAEILPCLPQVATIAIVQALEAIGLKDVQIKWINDVCVSRKKLAGVLCQSQALNEETLLVTVGMGVNVSYFPEDFDDVLALPATSVRAEAKRAGLEVAAGDALCTRIIDVMTSSLQAALAHLQNDGFGGALLKFVESHLAFKGEEVDVVLEESRAQTVQGRLLGLSSLGCLRVETPEGERVLVVGHVRPSVDHF